MSKLRFALLLATACTASNGFAGWISGGTGELRGDSGNPWFLDIPEHAGSISYCIDADEQAMGVSRQDLIRSVQDAIQFWQVQLPSAHLPSYRNLPKVKIKTGPFDFVDQPCTDDIDLAFQFGKVSTPNQIKFISEEHLNLSQFVGFAARLTYNSQLKGSGFIYIAPENGPLRPRGEGILERFWSEDPGFNTRLRAIIAHELGHVFGISHFGSSEHLMGQDFPEAVISHNRSYAYLVWRSRNVFRLGDRNTIALCFQNTVPKDLVTVFGLKTEERCIRIRLTGDGLLVYAFERDDLPIRLAARMSIKPDTWRERYHDVARLWLPENRKVFTLVPSYVKALSGPSVVETMVTGTIINYQPGEINQYSGILTFDPINVQLGAIIDGRINPNILEGELSQWTNPSAVK
jgi:hypothetical protein